MKRSTAVAAGVVVALGIVAALAIGLHKTKVDIHLRQTANGCTPDPVDTMTAGRFGPNVTWTVYNDNCEGPQYISLRNFRVKDTNTPETVVDPTPVDGGPINPGNSIPLPAHVVRFPSVWKQTYKYDIYVGSSAGGVVLRLDPDIDVWPF
jgi:hypothetical protein